MEEKSQLSPQTQVIMQLEDKYPLHDRRHEGYKLMGFVQGAKPARKNIQPIGAPYPYGAVPIWRYFAHNKGKRYTGAMLRQLRKERGEGIVKHITE